MVNYIISDLLIRINNGYNSKLNIISVLYSKTTLKILTLLYNEGIINGYYLTKTGKIMVKLKYYRNVNLFKGYSIVSKPGRRIFLTVNELKQKYQNKSFVLVSTTSGILLHKYAILKNLGGEVLFVLNYM